MAEGGSPTDASVLRPAIQIGTRGISQILKVYQAGTEEIRKLLTQECEVIFECKVCRSLFRGLPNLIAHKRAYCMNEYVEQRKEFPNFYSSDVVTVMPEAPKPGSELNRLLVQTGPVAVNQKAAKSVHKTNLVPLLSPSGKSSAWLKPKNTEEKPSTQTGKTPDAPIEIDGGENEEGENVSNITREIPARDREMLMCSTCNKKFTKIQALLKHYNHFHFGEQSLYKCPVCPSVFSYQRNCRRHLEKKHQKSTIEVSKLMKMVVRKATKVSRKLDPSNSPPQKEEKAVSKTAVKISPPGVPEVAGTEAKSNSNPEESAALIAPIVTPTPAPVTEMKSLPEVEEEVVVVKERLTCPDCGKEFEKRSILDRHMKVCADYAKIAVTFDMSLVKGMQHLATHSTLGQEKTSDSEGSPGKKRGRKAAPCRVSSTTSVVMDSDVESIASERSSRFDSSEAMPKLQPVAPLKAEQTETVSRPSSQAQGKDKSLAKQTKLNNIETVLQFLKNPKKGSIMTMVEDEAGKEENSEANNEMDTQPPTLEREDIADAESKVKGSKLNNNNSPDEKQTPVARTTRPLVVVSKESQPAKLSKTEPLVVQRHRSVSESKSKTRHTNLRSWLSTSVDRKVSPRAVVKTNGLAQDNNQADKTKKILTTQVAHVSKESKEYQEPKFEVIDLERHRPERAARKRERSEERNANNPSKRRELSSDSDSSLDPGKINRRAPRYASNFTTRRRQSMLEDILAGVDGEPVERSRSAGGERRNSEPTKEQSDKSSPKVVSATISAVARSPAASPVAKLRRDSEKSERGSPKKGEVSSGEVDSDEAGVLRCMLMDADAVPKGRRKGALLPSHIAAHVKYDEKKCNICNKNFETIGEMISHISKTHMNMKRYRCSLCSVEGMYFSEITRHIARTHRRAFRANHKLEWLSTCVKPINISSE